MIKTTTDQFVGHSMRLDLNFPVRKSFQIVLHPSIHTNGAVSALSLLHTHNTLTHTHNTHTHTDAHTHTRAHIYAYLLKIILHLLPTRAEPLGQKIRRARRRVQVEFNFFDFQHLNALGIVVQVRYLPGGYSWQRGGLHRLGRSCMHVMLCSD